MKNKKESGFTTLELIISTALVALIALSSLMIAHQTIAVTDNSKERVTATNQVQNAGYWFTRDTQMAEYIATEELSSNEFIIFVWTEWILNDSPIYHSATYYFEDLSNNIGKLMRHHWSSTGTDETTLVGEYICFNPSDPDNSSKANYQNPTLTVDLSASYKDATTEREYKITRRPNFNW